MQTSWSVNEWLCDLRSFTTKYHHNVENKIYKLSGTVTVMPTHCQKYFNGSYTNSSLFFSFFFFIVTLFTFEILSLNAKRFLKFDL